MNLVVSKMIFTNFQEMHALSEEMRNSQRRANELNAENDNIDHEVRTIGAQLQEFQGMIDNEHRKVDEVAELVGNAKSAAIETKQLATHALSEIRTILTQLNSIDSYDDNRLKELQRKLAKLEDQFKNSQIIERIKKLQIDKEAKTKILIRHADDMEQIKADVKNIDDIQQTLPDGCFRNLNLEP